MDAVRHFLEMRNTEELRHFCDATYEADDSYS